MPSPHPRQVSATSAICNLVLDFRSIRQAVLQAGALKLLVPLAGSMVPELRAAAVRALTHLTIKCEDAATRQVCARRPRSNWTSCAARTHAAHSHGCASGGCGAWWRAAGRQPASRLLTNHPPPLPATPARPPPRAQALLRELSWGAMRALLADPEPEVATEAAALLQNLFAASSEGIQEVRARATRLPLAPRLCPIAARLPARSRARPPDLLPRRPAHRPWG
jgi:hypothetical protein